MLMGFELNRVWPRAMLARQPEPGFSGSNGRARLPGSFGANGAAISNLFVRATETVPVADLKKKLIEMCRQRNKPYGMIVRRMDFPSSASFEDVHRLMSDAGQAGGEPGGGPPPGGKKETRGRRTEEEKP